MPRELPIPIVAVVTDRNVCGGVEPLLEAVEQAVAGGVNMVQLREKDLSENEQLAIARSLRRIVRGKAMLFINDQLTVALLAGADGVQLSESRAEWTEQAIAQGLVGRSVHDVKGATRAARQGVHFLMVGPVYHTQSHPGQTPTGVALIEQIAKATTVPVVGIGGITAENAGDVIAAGASGVAVIREVLAADDPTAAAARLRDAVTKAWQAGGVRAGKEST